MTVINRATLESLLRKHLTVHLHGVNTGGCRAVKGLPRVQQCSSACLASPPVLNSARAHSPIHYVPKA